MRAVDYLTKLYLSENLENLEYKTITRPEFTRKFTKKFLKSRMYSRDPDRQFRGMWEYPETFIESNSYISYAHIRNTTKVVAVGVLNNEKEGYGTAERQIALMGEGYEMIGVLGFYVASKHRRQYIAVNLAKNIENAFLSKNPEYRDTVIPVALCSLKGCNVAKKAFERIETVSY